MAVRICPWMDGITQRARDGGAYMSMDGRYNTKSQEGDAVMHEMKD